jgi:excisionase family DNA binding protein
MSDNFNSDSSDDPALTTRAAAELLGVSISTAQTWMENGALDFWKTPGGHRRARRSSVLGLLAAHAHASEAHKKTNSHTAINVALAPFDDEAGRLAALQRSGLLDSGADPAFDRLTWLATALTDSPIALITLLTADRQWVKSKHGIASTEIPRELAFCSYAILQDDVFMVGDTTEDVRFQNNPYVTGEPHIRFYAGYPLRDPDGYRLGTLCVIDHEPRRLRDKEVRALRELGAIATDLLRLRRLERERG